MLSALIAALLLAGLLLLLPVRLSIDLRKDGPAVQGGYRLAWLGVAVKRSETGGEVKAGPKGQRGSKAPSARSFISAAPALADILFELLRRIRLGDFSCRICFGLDDPADTAVASGCLWSLAWAGGLLSPAISCGISIEPDFEGERLEGELAADLDVRPVYLLLAALRVLRTAETRALLMEFMGWD